MRALVVTELGLSREKALAQKGLSMFKMQHAQQKRIYLFQTCSDQAQGSISFSTIWLAKAMA